MCRKKKILVEYVQRHVTTVETHTVAGVYRAVFWGSFFSESTNDQLKVPQPQEHDRKQECDNCIWEITTKITFNHCYAFTKGTSI